jgi:APA family basic amino acid/polyamine antiporter
MTATATTGEVFTRKASGLVRVMSPTSAFMYNILTMGLVFPWVYLQAPGALPGGKLVWGILLAMVIEIPIGLAYVFLSTALPRTGGDYVFQSRVLGGFWGFTLVISGYTTWFLQWVALSGWLVAYLGFAPLFLGLGATLGNPALSAVGLWFTTSTGIVITSIVNALVGMLLLISGFKNYVKVQYWMFYGTILAFATMLIVLFTTSPHVFVERLNAFAVASGGAANFYQTAVDAVKNAGIDLKPAAGLMATLLVAPIAWTSLQWAAYSAQQNGEIKDARSFKNQAFIIIGSLIVTGILLALLAVAFERVGGAEFLAIAGAGYWNGVGEATVNGFWLWPNILAVALTASPIVVILIAIGYILNSFQIVNNCYIGATRMLVAMSIDRLLPDWLSKVNDRLHTPVNAHLIYFLLSIPVILVYNLWGPWYSLTLGVTFAGAYVIATTCFAGALLPYRAKKVYEASPGAKYKLGNVPWVTILGGVGGVLATLMALAFLLSPALGVLGNWDFTDFPKNLWAQIIAFGLIAFWAIYFFIARRVQKSRGINVDYAFKEVPPE